MNGITRCILLAFVVLLGVSSAFGDLWIYEQFPVDPMAKENGDKTKYDSEIPNFHHTDFNATARAVWDDPAAGWIGGWGQGDKFGAPVDNGLTYSNNGYALQTDGGMATFRDIGQNPGIIWSRRFQQPYDESATIYLSAVGKFQSFGTGGVGRMGIAYKTVYAGNVYWLGNVMISTSGDANLWHHKHAGNWGDAYSLPTDQEVLFVGKYEFNIDGDPAFGDERWTVWIDPNLGMAEGDLTESDYAWKMVSENEAGDVQNPDVVPADGDIQWLLWGETSPNGLSDDDYQWDEIRIGTSWEDVLPADLAVLLGDFDGNGAVNGLDIPGFKAALADPEAWATANPDQPHPDQLGDFDGNGAFNGLDIPGFKTALAGTSIPEPATLVLLALGALGAIRRRR